MFSPSNVSSTRCSDNREMVINQTTIWKAIAYASVCVIGLMGNGLAVYLVIRYGNKKNPSDFYLINLAIADMLFLFTLPFIIVTALLRSWVFGRALCVLNLIFANVNRYAGTFTLVALSIDRYLAVCHPMASPRFRNLPCTVIIIISTWVLATLPMMPAFIFFAHETAAVGKSFCSKKCFVKWPEEYRERAATFYATYQVGIGFALPATLICIFYSLLAYRLRKSESHLEHVLGGDSHHHSHHKKITRLLIIVTGVFIFCWLPYCCMQIYVLVVTQHSSLVVNIFTFSVLLCYVNSMINPFLYTFTNKHFRINFAKICSNLCNKQPNISVHRITYHPVDQVKLTKTSSAPTFI